MSLKLSRNNTTSVWHPPGTLAQTPFVRKLLTLAAILFLPAICRPLDQDSSGAKGSSNLLVNGGFEEVSEGRQITVRGWESTGGPTFVARNAETIDAAAPALEEAAGAACLISEQTSHSGKRSAMMRRTGGKSDYFAWRQRNLPLEPGALYRLRFWVKADANARELILSVKPFGF